MFSNPYKAEFDESQDNKYSGKYRGTVINNVDPKCMGRLQVAVAEIPGVATTWATPSMPMTGKQMGSFTLPQVGAKIWVEFEQGNPDYPVWSGGVWSEGEVPAPGLAGTPVSPNIVLQTAGQTSLVLSDTTGITLKTFSGASIVINEAGITIQNGKGASIMLTGTSVFINNDALQILK